MLKGLSLLAASEVGSSISRTLRAVPYFVIGAVIALFGLGYLISAGHEWLLSRMTPAAASAVVALILIALAVMFFLIGGFIKSHRETRANNSRLAAGAMMAAPLATKLLGNRVTLATVAIAGVVAAGAVLGRYLGRN